MTPPLPLFTLTTLLLLLALPSPSHTARTETWTLPTLETHFMSNESGLNDGHWPPGSAFDSSIDFTIAMGSSSARCNATFRNGELPGAEPVPCAAVRRGRGVERVRFTMQRWTGLGERTPEMSFTLGVERAVGDGTTRETSVFRASKNFSANDSREPTSYLSCVLGPPLDGMRCRLHWVMSVPGEVRMEAVEQVE